MYFNDYKVYEFSPTLIDTHSVFYEVLSRNRKPKHQHSAMSSILFFFLMNDFK